MTEINSKYEIVKEEERSGTCKAYGAEAGITNKFLFVKIH